jgi:hypothetical protein
VTIRLGAMEANIRLDCRATDMPVEDRPRCLHPHALIDAVEQLAETDRRPSAVPRAAEEAASQLVAALSALDSIEHVVRQLVSFRVGYATLVMAGDVAELDVTVV